MVKLNFPKVRILARARNREHAYRLMDLGVTNIYRETYGSSLETAEDLLNYLGLPSREAAQARATFRRHDEERLLSQHGTYHDVDLIAEQSRAWQRELEEIFEQDAEDEVSDASEVSFKG